MTLRVLLALTLALAACDRHGKNAEAVGPAIWEQFSGERALQDVQRLVDLGPRPVGSAELEAARVYLTEQLVAAGWEVQRQAFTDETPQGPRNFVNLIATFPGGKSAPTFLLCSHYDTKFFAHERFVGANDGGSSNGVLLEMARVLAPHPELARKIQLVFFDGEEAFVSFTETDGLYGSRYFASDLVKTGQAKQFRGGILFDMVGDASLGITLPPDSPSQLTLGIFHAAEALGLRQHFTYARGGILDDHTPLNQAGIPTIDLIDFEYPPWHTPADTMDKLSAESLATVGKVAARFLVESAFR